MCWVTKEMPGSSACRAVGPGRRAWRWCTWSPPPAAPASCSRSSLTGCCRSLPQETRKFRLAPLGSQLHHDGTSFNFIIIHVHIHMLAWGHLKVIIIFLSLNWIWSALAVRYYCHVVTKVSCIINLGERGSFMGHLVVSPEAVVDLKASFNVNSVWKVVNTDEAWIWGVLWRRKAKPSTPEFIMTETFS